MKIDVITLFSEIFDGPLSKGVVGQAVQGGLIQVGFHNPREFATDVHRTVDDRPFGGGDGMVMMADPLKQALDRACQTTVPRRRVIYLSPHGEKLSHRLAKELSKEDQLVLICGRYGGVDQRFLNRHVDQEISIGDYVLSGGELAALVVIDVVARFLPGVLGNALSSENESFSNELLEYPQFTRPRCFEGDEVPEVLLSGRHEKINRWRHLVSLLRTKQDRPDLLSGAEISDRDWKDADALLKSMSAAERNLCGLKE